MAQNPPVTTVRTSHGITIQSEGGVVVGFIQSFTPAQSRPVATLYELNAATSGLPIENVPGNVGGLTLSVQRYDIYLQRMEQAFGTPDFEMLTDQNRPFIVREITRVPLGDGESFSEEVRQYTGCWFTNVGRGYAVTDSRVIMVRGDMAYLKKERLQ